MRKIISLTMVVFILMSLGGSAFAQEMNSVDINEIDAKIKNLKILVDNGTELTYTYERDGEFYKNIEVIKGNVIYSEIYVKRTNENEYDLVKSFSTTIPYITDTKEIKSIDQSTILSTVDPSTLDYVFYFSTKGNTKPKEFTLFAVRAALIKLVPWATPMWIAQVANAYYSYGEGYVYYKSDVYIETGVNPDDPDLKWYKEVINFYLDKNYVNWFDSETQYYQWW